jgi:serine/threonine-protein kinase
MPDTADRGFRVLEGLQLPDRYAIRRQIAQGGMASVWCAHDRVLGRNVAIKVISARFARDQSAVRRFNREARAAARLSSHRHVVTIYDVGHAVDHEHAVYRPFIVMEYLAGGTVADALRVGAVTRNLAVRWIRQASSALDYAHRQGVIHRDIKPANLLLDCERMLYVADFGIAQIGTEDTFTGSGQMLGTAAYIAPEQVLGRKASEASDRYALAVAAFELLAGRRPFVAPHFAAQARQHLEEDPPAASSVNPSLPGALDGVLARGMAKHPKERWQTGAELADAIDAALNPRPVAALAPRRAPRPRRPAATVSAIARPRPQSRRRLAVAALAAGVSGIVLAAVASGMFSAAHGSPASHTAKTQAAATTAGRHRHRSRPHARPASTTTSTIQASPVAASTPPPTADTLEARGHALLNDGDYSGAISVLRRAVRAASPSSLTYAYALFDLGRSLRLSGDPKDAATVLWQRMKIPNQTGIVRYELELALRALGARAQHRGGHGEGD